MFRTNGNQSQLWLRLTRNCSLFPEALKEMERLREILFLFYHEFAGFVSPIIRLDLRLF